MLLSQSKPAKTITLYINILYFLLSSTCLQLLQLGGDQVEQLREVTFLTS